MTIKYLAGNIITGLVADTKPTNVSTGTTFIETDSGNIYQYNGSSYDLISIGSTRDSSVYTIYVAGTTVKVRNNVTGVIDYTADNTVNAVTAINSAINNIQNITGAGLDTTYGGTIEIADGKYKCTTQITLNFASTARRGIRLRGAGSGTILSFEPSTSLTNAIRFNNMAEGGIEHLRIQTNANVVNYITVNGDDSNNNSWTAARGHIHDIVFEAPGFPPVSAPGVTAGQIGLLIEQSTAGTPFYWVLENLRFLGLDTSIRFKGGFAGMNHMSNILMAFCNHGIDIDTLTPPSTQTGQINGNNIWMLGNTFLGDYAVRCRDQVTNCFFTNIVSELMLDSPTVCSAVLLDSGCSKNSFINVVNAFDDQSTRFTVKDNSGNLTNVVLYNDFSTASNYLRGVKYYVNPDFSLPNTAVTNLRTTVSSSPQGIEFGPNDSTGGIPYFDWHTDSGDGDYRTRFQRNAGANGTFAFIQTGTGGWDFSGGPVGLSEGVNIISGTSVGTKIGTATSQKIGFYNATPIVQPTAVADSTATAASASAQLNLLLARMRSLGLIAT